ncbi:Zn(II)2Cys6 transcription factor [Aspergillus lucknowensis]|uniref:Zn(2)-C6 fungal-type domain-containing protein n=1 Tax=Aspergillus lucknowensis TaxID=176173 RepID=A0ABR4LDG0_9EURO
MVYYGALSKGCELCRRRKIKCDERKPRCLKCEKSNRVCPGYRDLGDVLFRDESSRALRLARRVSTTSSLKLDQGRETIYYNPSLPVQELAAGFFFSKYNTYDGPYLANTPCDWLSQSYLDGTSCEALRAAVEAVGMAGLANTSYAPQIASRSRERYCIALSELNDALLDPTAAAADTTLMAVILLGLFEIVSFETIDESRYWTAHVTGALTLLQLRGQDQFARERGGQLYVHARSQILVACMAQKLPVPPALVNTTYGFETSTLRQSWKDGNLATPGSISEISFRLINLRAAIAHGLVDTLGICEQALAIDADLEDWRLSAMVKWAYQIVPAPESADKVYFSGKQHRYANLWVAKAWLNWRMMRVLVNQLILENCSGLGFDVDFKSRARAVVRDLCTEICISVPSFDGTPHILAAIHPLHHIAAETLNHSDVRSFAFKYLFRIHKSTGVRQAGRLAEIASQLL